MHLTISRLQDMATCRLQHLQLGIKNGDKGRCKQGKVARKKGRETARRLRKKRS
jgi:hypothetical protein